MLVHLCRGGLFIFYIGLQTFVDSGIHIGFSEVTLFLSYSCLGKLILLRYNIYNIEQINLHKTELSNVSDHIVKQYKQYILYAIINVH